jgi:hypothetical protein
MLHAGYEWRKLEGCCFACEEEEDRRRMGGRGGGKEGSSLRPGAFRFATPPGGEGLQEVESGLLRRHRTRWGMTERHGGGQRRPGENWGT